MGFILIYAFYKTTTDVESHYNRIEVLMPGQTRSGLLVIHATAVFAGEKSIWHKALIIQHSMTILWIRYTEDRQMEGLNTDWK